MSVLLTASDVFRLKEKYDGSGGLRDFSSIRRLVHEACAQPPTDPDLAELLENAGYRTGHCLTLEQCLGVMGCLKERYVVAHSLSNTASAFAALCAEGTSGVRTERLRKTVCDFELSPDFLSTLHTADPGVISSAEFNNLFRSEASSDDVSSTTDIVPSTETEETLSEPTLERRNTVVSRKSSASLIQSHISEEVYYESEAEIPVQARRRRYTLAELRAQDLKEFKAQQRKRKGQIALRQPQMVSKGAGFWQRSKLWAAQREEALREQRRLCAQHREWNSSMHPTQDCFAPRYSTVPPGGGGGGRKRPASGGSVRRQLPPVLACRPSSAVTTVARCSSATMQGLWAQGGTLKGAGHTPRRHLPTAYWES